MSEDDEAPSLLRVPAGVTDDPQFMKKYELERELGVGGAGVVFCARHRELDERVAIKFLLAPPDNAEAMARFRREARAANRVKSEHVVRIIDVSTIQNGVPYVVMEYLEGTDLERLLLESPDAQLPVRDAVEFVLQTCEALAECHAIGIVHRDLKPSNLFCTHGADGLPIIKVLDFGISKLGTVTIDEAMTGKHAIMGSPRYMSPEQFATPTDVDHRADIWALGIILYELVTGIVPFAANTLIGIWERVKNNAPPPIVAMRRDAPRALEPVVLRCLEKERANRYQNVAEFAKALLPFAPERCRASVARIVRIVEAPGMTTASLFLPPSGRPSAGTPTSVSVAAQSRPPRWSRSRVLGPVIATSAAVLVAWMMTRPRSAPQPAGSSAVPAYERKQPVLERRTAAASPSSKPPPASRVEPNGAVSAPTTPPPSAPRAALALRRTLIDPGVARQREPASSAEPALPTLPTDLQGDASATAAASSSLPPAVDSAVPSKPSPWIVDIVEQRKRKSKEAP